MISKNAVAQAVRVKFPTIKRDEFFKIISTPQNITSVSRYWQSTYNIRSWDSRPLDEQAHAVKVAVILVQDFRNHNVIHKFEEWGSW